LKAFLLVVGAIVALLAAIVGYAAYANYAAERAAESFCAATALGSSIDAALERAAKHGARHLGPLNNEGKEEHDFNFQGWVFNVGVCRVGVANGKVISIFTALEGD